MILCRLNRIYFPVTTLGYGRRIGVWVQGCSRACKGCMSPEMQPREGAELPVEDVLKQLPADLEADGLTISGGEPFDQPAAVAAIVRWFRQHYGDDVLIYTGCQLEELEKREDPHVRWLLENIAALVDGPYVEELNTGRGLRGSENQRLHVFRHAPRYADFLEQPRAMQCVDEQGSLFFIGVAPKQKDER